MFEQTFFITRFIFYMQQNGLFTSLLRGLNKSKIDPAVLARKRLEEEEYARRMASISKGPEYYMKELAQKMEREQKEMDAKIRKAREEASKLKLPSDISYKETKPTKPLSSLAQKNLIAREEGARYRREQLKDLIPTPETAKKISNLDLAHKKRLEEMHKPPAVDQRALEEIKIEAARLRGLNEKAMQLRAQQQQAQKANDFAKAKKFSEDLTRLQKEADRNGGLAALQKKVAQLSSPQKPAQASSLFGFSKK